MSTFFFIAGIFPKLQQYTLTILNSTGANYKSQQTKSSHRKCKFWKPFKVWEAKVKLKMLHSAFTHNVNVYHIKKTTNERLLKCKTNMIIIWICCTLIYQICHPWKVIGIFVTLLNNGINWCFDNVHTSLIKNMLQTTTFWNVETNSIESALLVCRRPHQDVSKVQFSTPCSASQITNCKTSNVQYSWKAQTKHLLKLGGKRLVYQQKNSCSY